MRAQASSSHVLVYGPPGAGKLSVARELSRRTGFRLLDNHLSIDVGLALFDGFATPGFTELVQRLRLLLFDSAAEAGNSVVSTLVFADPEDREFVDEISAIVAKYGGAMCFVQLCPEREELERRIVADERGARGKIHTLEGFERLLARYDVFRRINEGDLSIDNTSLSPEAAAERICAHFEL